MGEEDDGRAIDLARPTAAPPQLRAAAKARLLAASIGASNAAPERERIAGRYRLVREIGRGGMGSVWEAELVPIGKRVAIKLMRRETTTRAGVHEARLLREAQAASAIGHEHIVRVDDFGIDPDSGPFLVMELLRGRALSDEIAAHAPMPWPRVAGILVQLCSALAAAHEHGIVHRDLKPANVFLVRREGDEDHCKLLDFGLCKPPPAAEIEGGLTTTGARLGTPGYMAPEQIRADAIDGRADLYALGCVAYEMLSGQPPFLARRAADLIEAHLHEVPRPLPEGTPIDAVRVVERALAKDPDDRFPDAHAMVAAIRAMGLAPRPTDHTVPAPASAPIVASSIRPPTRRRWRAPLFAVLALGSGAVIAALALPDDPPRVDTVPTPAPARSDPEPTPSRAAPAAVVPAPVVGPAPPPIASTPTPPAAAPERPPPTRTPRRRAPAPDTAPPPDTAPAPPPPPSPSPSQGSKLVDGIRDPFGGP